MVFAKGLIIGLLIALPVGPVAILCIQRALTQGQRHGLVSGLGAASADAIYGAVAALGVSFVSTCIQEYNVLIHWLGGIALCLIGLRTFLAIPQPVSSARIGITHAGDFLSTFLLTLMNPMTILAFAAVFANAGLADCSQSSAAVLVAGVFCGSALWWLALCIIAGTFKHLLEEAQFRIINRIAGVLIILFGIIVMIRGYWGTAG